MFKEKFIVLRSSPMRRTRDVFDGPSFAPGSVEEAIAKTAPLNLSVDFDSFSRDDIPKISRHNDVMMLAPAVPMKWVEPAGNNTAPAAPAASANTWGIEAVGAHTSPFTGAGIKVAVLDTGCNDHDAFRDVQLKRENFTAEAGNDLNGHGTHCAGTIFGGIVNNMRIGVAPGVREALIAKVFDANGHGSSDKIVEAINWAVKGGAHVISMSLGMDFPRWVQELKQKGLPEAAAISRALEGHRLTVQLFERLAAMIRSMGQSGLTQPTILVAAAGNESRRAIPNPYEIAVAPPAVSEGIMSVAALAKAGGVLTVADFSNTGANVAAPGVDIISAGRDGGLRSMDGTSMATPHVAGVAALWAEKLMGQGLFNAFQLSAKIVGRCAMDNIKAGTENFDVGAGIVCAPQDKH